MDDRDHPFERNDVIIEGATALVTGADRRLDARRPNIAPGGVT